MEFEQAESPISPRGTRRVLYVSDPSTIALFMLPAPVEAEDLRRWVDMIADSGVDMFQQDVYNQGFTVYWQSERFQYDWREQHERFLPLLEAGVQPLQVLLDHSHKRGMLFFAGFRMNDCHNFPAYANFHESHPEWQLDWPRGRPLDFTFDQVRQYIFEVMQEVVNRFDLDGLELTFRDDLYFPVSTGPDRAHLMTDMVRRVRGLLDDRSKAVGRRVLLGARVWDTFEECLDQGLDVRTWITEGLIDYVSPSGVMQSNFNAPYQQFAELTRKNQCMLYPGVHPWSSYWDCMGGQSEPMTASNFRALAHTLYAAGADGISVYNHFCALLWRPPFYPQTLQVFQELRDLQKVAHSDRHYVFHSSPGADKEPKIVLDRSAAKPSAVFQFQLYEQMERVSAATLLLQADLTEQDQLEVRINDTLLEPGPFGRFDARGLERFPDIRSFPVPADLMAYGRNELIITLTDGSTSASAQIAINKVEVFVQPK